MARVNLFTTTIFQDQDPVINTNPLAHPEGGARGSSLTQLWFKRPNKKRDPWRRLAQTEILY
jgi:hypothetical protein